MRTNEDGALGLLAKRLSIVNDGNAVKCKLKGDVSAGDLFVHGADDGNSEVLALHGGSGGDHNVAELEIIVGVSAVGPDGGRERTAEGDKNKKDGECNNARHD